MDSLIIYFLPTILALGIITSYEDIKEGKIRNKYVVVGLVLGVTTNLLLVLFNITTLEYLTRTAILFIASMIISLLLWYFGMWGAGDAKLFVTYALLVPISTYNNNTPLPQTDLIINTIIPLFVYLIFFALLKSNKKHKIDAIKKTLRPRTLLFSLLVVFSLSWVTGTALTLLGIQSNYLLSLVAILTLSRILGQTLKEKTAYLFLAMAAARIALNTHQIISETFLMRFLILTLGYIITSAFIRNVGELYKDHIHVTQLKEGDIIADTITRDGRKVIEKNISENMILLKADGGPADRDTVRKISSLYKTNKLKFNKIMIRQKIRTAPFMFLGTMITLVCGSNIITFIRNIF
jgi:hypothetical protein